MHLTIEALARLVDEAPAADEAEHLRDCLVCRRELEELREQTAALAEMPLMEAGQGGWAALESRLLEEGLVRTAAPAMVAAPRQAPGRGAWLRIAAAVALFISGGAAGALLWDRTPGVPPTATALPVPRVAPPAGRLEEATPVLAAAAGSETIAPAEGVRLAGNSTGPDRPAPRPRRAAPVSAAVRNAEAELADAEAAYLTALQRYAELADPSSGADPATRLEALDRLVEMSARALDRSPDDDRLNGYHLAALSERDMLRRQIQRAVNTTWF